jgi:hypothetical protein
MRMFWIVSSYDFLGAEVLNDPIRQFQPEMLKWGHTGTSDVGSATNGAKHYYPVSAVSACMSECLLYDI